MIIQRPQISSVIFQRPQLSTVIIQRPQISSTIIQRLQISSVIIQRPQISSAIIQRPQVSSVIIQRPQIRSVIIQRPQISSVIIQDFAGNVIFWMFPSRCFHRQFTNKLNLYTIWFNFRLLDLFCLYVILANLLLMNQFEYNLVFYFV